MPRGREWRAVANDARLGGVHATNGAARCGSACLSVASGRTMQALRR